MYLANGSSENWIKIIAVVELVALMYSNCGFIGIPMAQGFLGQKEFFI